MSARGADGSNVHAATYDLDAVRAARIYELIRRHAIPITLNLNRDLMIPFDYLFSSSFSGAYENKVKREVSGFAVISNFCVINTIALSNLVKLHRVNHSDVNCVKN